MIDFEPLIREELQCRVPPVDPAIANWRDILDRSGETQRRRRGRLAATVVAGAAAAALASSPLGGAVTDALGGFSDWLRGTPGAPTSSVVQRQFDAADFPGSPKLRELVHVTLDGHRVVLYGFTTRQVVCLRLVVRKVGTGPQTACVSRAELRRTRDPVLPVKGNLTVSKYAVTFGLAAHDVTRVAVLNDRGTSRAVLRNGAFLSVFRSGRRDASARAVIAQIGQRRPVSVPLSVQRLGQPPLRSGLRPHGPSRVTRTVSGGTIGWFVRREARGLSPVQAHVDVRGCCNGYTRMIQPDPDDFLLMLISDHSPSPLPSSVPRPKPGAHQICVGTITHGGLGSSCTTVESLFRERPLALSWGFSGAGQQFWLVDGLASDDVTRIEVFLGTGEHWQAPLRDNVTFFRVQRAKFPVRVVAYDAGGHVIAVQTIKR